MVNNKDITGIILAGGKSSRMGTDKGFINFKGKPFIKYSIEALTPLVKDVIIVSDNPDYDVFGLKRVTDIIKNTGPLAGLYSGLEASKTNLNIVLSCDVPLVNYQILKILIENTQDDIDVIQLKSNDKSMPLIALYKTNCKSVCLDLLQKGERRLRMVIKNLKSKTIVLDEYLETFTKNINTPIELKTLQDAVNH